MQRREFIKLIGAVTVAWPLAARAQRPKVWRVAQVRAGTPKKLGRSATALEERLNELGYVNGKTIMLVNRFVPRPQAMKTAIEELHSNIDLLVVWGTVGSVYAKKLISDLPVVFVSVGAPVEIGLISSLARPGGNMTGVTFEAADQMYPKRLQVLKELVPNLKRVAVLGAQGDPNVTLAMTALQKSAPVLGVTLLPVYIRSTDDLPAAFDQMRRKRAEGLVVIAGNLTAFSGKRIADLALKYRLPSCHAFNETVVAGGLVSLGPNRVWMARQAADYVDKIIKGSKAKDLPVEEPNKYDFYINLKTARTLGIKVPEPLLALADQIIK